MELVESTTDLTDIDEEALRGSAGAIATYCRASTVRRIERPTAYNNSKFLWELFGVSNGDDPFEAFVRTYPKER